MRPTQSVCTCSRAFAASSATSARASGRISSPAALICSARPVSTTSEEVSPKWIQRPAGPADAASTSTNAAVSWSVIRSRSLTASTVKVRVAGSPRGPPRSGPRHLLAGGDLDLADRLEAGLVGPQLAELPAGVALDHLAGQSIQGAGPVPPAPRPLASAGDHPGAVHRRGAEPEQPRMARRLAHRHSRRRAAGTYGLAGRDLTRSGAALPGRGRRRRGGGGRSRA